MKLGIRPLSGTNDGLSSRLKSIVCVHGEGPQTELPTATNCPETSIIGSAFDNEGRQKQIAPTATKIRVTKPIFHLSSIDWMTTGGNQNIAMRECQV